MLWTIFTVLMLTTHFVAFSIMSRTLFSSNCAKVLAEGQLAVGTKKFLDASIVSLPFTLVRCRSSGQCILGMTNVILSMTYVMTGLSQKIAFCTQSLTPARHAHVTSTEE